METRSRQQSYSTVLNGASRGFILSQRPALRTAAGSQSAWVGMPSVRCFHGHRAQYSGVGGQAAGEVLSNTATTPLVDMAATISDTVASMSILIGALRL